LSFSDRSAVDRVPVDVHCPIWLEKEGNSMYKLFLISILSALTLFAQQEDGSKKKGPLAHVLTVAEFDQLLAKPDQLLIIDVRRPDEITAMGGFPVYLSIQAKDLAKSLAWIPRDRTIVALSNHAGRGSVAADLLTKAGFKVAGAMGAMTYAEQGGKNLVRITPPAGDGKKE
jgi:rhodanese-related sulfurtransferase